MFGRGRDSETDHPREFGLVDRDCLPDRPAAEPWESGAVLTDDYAPYDLLIGTETGENQPRGDR